MHDPGKESVGRRSRCRSIDSASAALVAASRTPILILIALICLVACQARHSIEDIRQMQEQGLFEPTIEPLRSMLREDGDDPELQYRLGVALRMAGSPSLAVWPLQKASEDDDWFWRASVELAQSALASENPDLAIRTTSAMIDRDDRRFDAWLLRAEARIARRKDYEEALADVEEALALREDSYVAQLTRASILLLLARPEEAEMSIEKLERLADTAGLGDSERSRLCVVKASLFAEKGATDAARDQLETCLDRFPWSPPAVEGGVRLYDQWHDPERAIEILAQAIEWEPTALSYRIALAERLRRSGREDGAAAEKLLRDATTQAGLPLQKKMAWVALADHYLALDRYSEAAEAVGQSLELDPDPSAVEIMAYADLLAMAGDHEEARDAALRLDREEYRDLIEGRILLREGRAREALDHFDRALAIWPNNAAARYYAARAAEQIGNLRRAIAEYRASIRADAGFTDAGLRLARLHLAQRQYPAASRAARHHLNAHPGDSESILLMGRAALLDSMELSPELLAQLQSPEVRTRWIALQAATLSTDEGPEAAITFLEIGLDAGSGPVAGAFAEDEVFKALIRALIDAGRLSEARARFEEQQGRSASIHHEVDGIILRAEGRVFEAREALSRAVEEDPDNDSAWFALGQVRAQLGSTEAAVEAFDKAAEGSAEPWVPQRFAGRALYDVSRLQDARSCLEESLREFPHDTASVLLLAKVCLRLDACQEDVPALSRRAAFLGAPREARALLASLPARGEVLEETTPD